MKKILISGFIALAALAAVLALRSVIGGRDGAWTCSDGQWVRQGRPPGPAPQESCPPAADQAPAEEETGPAIPDVLPLEMNFFELGRLVLVDPSRRTGPWDFSYERLGAALQTVSLIFNKDSVCVVDGKEAPCSDLDAAVGIRTRVEGYRLEPPYVLVRLLLAPPR